MNQEVIDLISPIPMYMQIKEILRKRILNGTYKEHQKMPSEAEMMINFGVSRITVRQAIGDLEKEGLIFKRHGKGTYVSKPKASQTLTQLEGFGEAMKPHGYETTAHLISGKLITPDIHVTSQLNLPKDTQVVEIRRLRYLNREPISVDVSYFSQEIGERLLKEDFVSRDIFMILENDYGFPLGNADMQIESILADSTLAELLKIDVGAPILKIERLTSTKDGRPLDFEYLYYRGDAFKYKLELQRNH